MKIAYITLGCKVNQYETQAVEALLGAAGHETSDVAEAHVVVVNTCAVTGESARKSRQAARKVARLNPSAKLVICGCFSQSDAAAARELGADFVGGSGERLKIVDYINNLSDSADDSAPTPAAEYREFERLPAGSFDGHARAYLKVQDGCSNYCAYCIIPYLRGRPRSLDSASAAEQAREIARQGYGEIVLTGIEISSYGIDNSENLADLADAVSAATLGAARIRLGSLEPSFVTQALVERLAAVPNLCPHFHLSLQSGAAGVLQRMRRKYTPDEYANVVQNIRAAFGDAAITTDLIVGFPGETDDEFNETLAFIERIGFSQMHIFPYSKRDGTRAADMPNHLPNAVKERRAKAAAAVAAKCRAQYLDRQIGRVLDVLFETETDGISVGHSGNYAEVAVAATGLRGKTLAVTITAVRGGRLEGVLA